jgi:hypothetical protein
MQNWVNPIKRADDKNKTGREAKKNREEKLPSDIALNALAEIFANDPIMRGTYLQHRYLPC